MFKNSAGNLCTHLIYVSYIYACVRGCVRARARVYSAETLPCLREPARCIWDFLITTFQ